MNNLHWQHQHYSTQPYKCNTHNTHRVILHTKASNAFRFSHSWRSDGAPPPQWPRKPEPIFLLLFLINPACYGFTFSMLHYFQGFFLIGGTSDCRLCEKTARWKHMLSNPPADVRLQAPTWLLCFSWAHNKHSTESVAGFTDLSLTLKSLTYRKKVHT